MTNPKTLLDSVGQTDHSGDGAPLFHGVTGKVQRLGWESEEGW